MPAPLNPKAKFDNLVIQELSDEILIYNLENDKAYGLNLTSALIWQNCDGNKSIDEIAQALEKQLHQKVPNEAVWLALEELKKEGLVNYQKEEFPQFSNISRRELAKRASLASLVALPMIMSLVAPEAKAQGSVANPLCRTCVAGIGVGSGCGVTNCPGLTCLCFANNSCMGVGQAAMMNSCEDCETVGGSTSDNSFQCV